VRYPTKAVGDGTLVASRIAATAFCRMVGVVGQNNGADAYLHIFELAAVPANGTKPKFSCSIDAARPFTFFLQTPVDMDACCVAISSTQETLTAAAGTPVTIQVLLAS